MVKDDRRDSVGLAFQCDVLRKVQQQACPQLVKADLVITRK